MQAGSVRRVCVGAATSAILLTAAGAAEAGGFAVREQSTEFQGSSFAGNAAGSALSSMFWNPAAIAQFNGINTESAYTLILPDVQMHAVPPSAALVAGADSGNVGRDALVPGTYASMQLSPQVVLGMSFNAPFGLTTKPENLYWAGSTQATTSQIKTYNLQTALAYRLTPALMIGVGLQIEKIEATLRRALAVSPVAPIGTIEGDDVAFGFTAGLLWTPSSRTSIGLGYRSSISHELDGSFQVTTSPIASGATATVKLPDVVTLSARQAIAPRLTALGTIEWTNWSTVPSLDVYCTTAPGPGCGAVGSQLTSLYLGWHDSWFFSAGLEYAYSPALTLRTGVAWEKSPIQNATERTLRLPDTDRLWASAGATWNINEKMSLQFAYTHIFGEDSPIVRTEAAAVYGNVEAQVDIISIGYKYKWGGAPLSSRYESLK